MSNASTFYDFRQLGVVLEGLDNETHTKDLFNAYLKNHDDSDWTYLRYGPFDSIDEFESWIKKQVKEMIQFFSQS